MKTVHTYCSLYFTLDMSLEIVHQRVEHPAVDKWECRAHIRTSVFVVSSPSPWVLLYLAPPLNCMFTSWSRVLQWTLVTDRCPPSSFPSATSEVTSILNKARLNEPPSCLKHTHKQSRCSHGPVCVCVWGCDVHTRKQTDLNSLFRLWRTMGAL